jgi:hypothetical protein
MSIRTTVRSLTITTLLAALCLAGSTPASAAPPTEAQACAATIAKAMSLCVKKATILHAVCYKKTNARCLDTDEKLLKTYSTVPLLIQKSCLQTQVISDAGYGPYTFPKLHEHFTNLCRSQSQLVLDRSFGIAGQRYADGDKTAQKMMQVAGKASVKLLSTELKKLGKCVTTGCAFDYSATVTTAAGKLAAKYPTFAATMGISPAEFMADSAAQVASSVLSPCDPLDSTRCVFPFPNDHFSLPGATTDSGRQVNIGRRAVFAPLSPDFTVDTSRWSEADGFSIGPMLLLNNVDIDLDETGATPLTDLDQTYAPDAPALLFDAETGDRELLWLERDLRGSTLADRPIIGRVGRNLKEGHRYIVALRNMKNSSGDPVPASAAFAVYRDSTPTTVLPVEARRPQMEDILDRLTSFGVDRSELYLAWDFTTQSSHSTSKRLLHMRDDAFDILGSASPAFNVTSTTNGVDGKVFRIVDGTFQVPLYMNGGGAPGTTLRTGPDGLPVNNGDFFTAGFRCVIPLAATTGGSAPAVPARISLYGHGLLGSHTEVDATNVRDFANEHNVVLCATSWSGFSSGDTLFVASVLADFTNFPTFIDRQHQGMLNMLFLGRLLKHADGLASHASFKVDGESMLDRSELFYDGNSQGGILGGVLAAVAQDATRFSLGVPGMNYSTLLNRSTDFSVYDNIFAVQYPNSTDRNLLLSMAQNIWDRTDPNGHVWHQIADPYANTPVKKLLCQVAFGDHQVAPVTMEVAARTNGMFIYKSDDDIVVDKPLPDVTPYYDIPKIPSFPFDGSALVIWDSGNPPPPIGNITPYEITNMDPEWADLEACAKAGTGGDPHSCPRRDPDARIQKSEFLKTGGAIVDVCAGLPSPGHVGPPKGGGAGPGPPPPPPRPPPRRPAGPGLRAVFLGLFAPAPIPPPPCPTNDCVMGRAGTNCDRWHVLPSFRASPTTAAGTLLR